MKQQTPVKYAVGVVVHASQFSDLNNVISHLAVDTEGARVLLKLDVGDAR